MTRTFRYCAGVLVFANVAVIVPASAQVLSPPRTSAPLQNAPRPPDAAKKTATPSASSIAGKWSGQLTQVGSDSPYKLELAITAKGAETTYPDLDCTGKLTRVGSSKSYAFFIEVITRGSFNNGGHCPDGTITVARQGDNLALCWFGSIRDSTVVAYGTLSKK